MGETRKLPPWFKVSYNQAAVQEMAGMMQALSLNTVCSEADCPNLGECYKKRTAAFMILGSQCTRHCRFCNVSHGAVSALDPQEPAHVAMAVKKLGLKHAVITCVTRDDLADYGAEQFALTIDAIRQASPGTTVEVLISDMGGRRENLDIIIKASPDIINHNVETVPALYKEIRPEADYERSLFVLDYVKQQNRQIYTKTGIMVGLGESPRQVTDLMQDVIQTGCDIFTIGQYMQPSNQHYPMKEFITPDQFEAYKACGEAMGFLYVYSGPKVRSSYHAGEFFDS